MGRGLRRQPGKNILNLERQRAEEKEEIVDLKILKGGCDVFFSSQYNRLAKAGRPDAADALEGRGDGAGITQLRDPDAGWMRDNQTLEGVSQNRTGSSGTAATTVARILL